MLHNFADSLAKSHAQENAPWWEIVYRKAFPNFASMVSVRADGWAQRGGIDRVLTLKSGKQVTVDEKVREEDWPDVLLERWSDKGRRVPGWIQKDLACDFIAYAFIPSQRCYLFPFLQLRRVWIEDGRDWIELAENNNGGFKIVHADNGRYVTESIAVPIDVLLASMRRTLVVEWGSKAAEAAA